MCSPAHATRTMFERGREPGEPGPNAWKSIACCVRLKTCIWQTRPPQAMFSLAVEGVTPRPTIEVTLQPREMARNVAVFPVFSPPPGAQLLCGLDGPKTFTRNWTT